MGKKSKVYSIILAILILAGNVFTQDLKKDFYSSRRAELIKNIKDGIFVLSAAKAQPMQSISDEPFKQDKNFSYLTGYKLPDAILIIAPNAPNKTMLFVPKANSYSRETGKVVQKEMISEAINNYGVDTAYNLTDFEKVFKRYAASEKTIYCSRMDKDTYSIISKYTKDESGNSIRKIMEASQLVSDLRIVKTNEEIEFLQKAIDITTEAHIEAMKAAQPKMNERTLDAIIGYIYRLRFASGFGFESIVGSGPNSLVLHYMDNDQEMKDGTTCVMDLGAAYNGYSADITRTIPVNGTYTKEQKEIYQAVLNAEKEGIKLFKPGVKPNEVELKVADFLRDELFKLGLVTDKNTTWQHRIWYTHGCSHSIGLDVHDATPYQSLMKDGYKPNMVFTIEPGLYISEKSLEMAKMFKRGNITEKEINDFIEKVRPIARKYENIGIRIEDDVLVTKDGNIVLSAKCPKEISDVEKMMKQKSRFVD